jgi:hypothetical protein
MSNIGLLAVTFATRTPLVDIVIGMPVLLYVYLSFVVLVLEASKTTLPILQEAIYVDTEE